MTSNKISDQPVKLDDSGRGREMGWGSDAIVEQLSRLKLRYIALVPGSSYRGVHDSLVNYMGNTEPQMLVCLHEEHSISIAHGYAKVTERPMAAAVHANVGLMHATMAIYNAYCDRVPILILGATGPVDASKRRPWIDWIHTSLDQGALVRNFVKFDDQPGSVNAAVQSLVRCYAVTASKPCAPVYLCLDSQIQEDKIDPETVDFPDTARYLQTKPPGPALEDMDAVMAALQASKKPLFLLGRLNRSRTSWHERIGLAELCGARVLTDLKQACTFPTAHAQHACPPSVFTSPQASEVIQTADLIISFEWVDLAGTLQAAFPSAGKVPSAKVVHISLDGALHNGWSKDHFGFPLADISVQADADKFLSGLLKRVQSLSQPLSGSDWPAKSTSTDANGFSSSDDDRIFMGDLASALYAAISPDDMCLVRVPLGWKGQDLRATHPLAYMGQDGGGGLASGPGQVVGAALALKDLREDNSGEESGQDDNKNNLLAVGILGDGDFLMGSTALWTAARYKLPLLTIVANNASFFNDEVHQERVAKTRARPVENKWIGMRIDDPMPDLSRNAESLGLTTVGSQVRSKSGLKNAMQRAVDAARNGKSVVLDVQVLPDGYSSALEKAK